MANRGPTPEQSQGESQPTDDWAATRGAIEQQMALVGQTREALGDEAFEALVEDAARRTMVERQTGKPSATAGGVLQAFLAEREQRMRDLEAAGLPLYVEDDTPPPCPHCNDAGFVRVEPLRTRGAVSVPYESPSIAADSVRHAMQRVRPCVCRAGAVDVAALVERSGLPVVQRGWTFAAFQPLDGKARALAEVQAWVASILDGGTDSLQIVGGPGRGKSHLASAAVLALCAGGRAVRYEYVPSLLNALRPGARYATPEAWDALERAGVLVLDDLGADQLTEWGEGRLNTLIHERLHQARPTVITADLTPQQLVDALGARAASRMREYGLVIVEGEDRRGR